jgi:hypothetical protein
MTPGKITISSDVERTARIREACEIGRNNDPAWFGYVEQVARPSEPIKKSAKK